MNTRRLIRAIRTTKHLAWIGRAVVLAFTLAGFPGQILAADDPLAAQRSAMALITDTADKICSVIQTAGTSEGSQVQGQVKAELGGLASKLANVGVTGSADINNEQYQNVLRSDLATTLKNNAECKLNVFNTLQAKLLSVPPPVTTATATPAKTEAAGGAPTFTAAAYVGQWMAADRQGGIPQIAVLPQAGGLAVHLWGECHPSPCDWGSAPATPMSMDISVPTGQPIRSVTATFKQNFAERHVTLRLLEQNRLEATIDTHFLDKSGRADYETASQFSRASP